MSRARFHLHPLLGVGGEPPRSWKAAPAVLRCKNPPVIHEWLGQNRGRFLQMSELPWLLLPAGIWERGSAWCRLPCTPTPGSPGPFARLHTAVGLHGAAPYLLCHPRKR